MPAPLKHRHHPKTQAAAAALFLLLSAGAGAQIYKWTDAAGTVHYSQTPPPSQTFTEMAVTPPASSAGEDAAQVQDLITRQRDAATREAEDKHTAAERAKQLAERAATCVKARDDLARLSTGPEQRHLVRDGDGSVRRLSADEHQEMTKRLQQVIADNCGE
jgi:hypothetical protein